MIYAVNNTIVLIICLVIIAAALFGILIAFKCRRKSVICNKHCVACPNATMCTKITSFNDMNNDNDDNTNNVGDKYDIEKMDNDSVMDENAECEDGDGCM